MLRLKKWRRPRHLGGLRYAVPGVKITRYLVDRWGNRLARWTWVVR